MRDIEFRIYDDYEKKFITLEDYQKKGAILVNNDGTLYLSSDYRFLLNMMIMNDRFIVQQYTGLKDKNGKKIFEEDIVTYTGENVFYKVIFNKLGYWCLEGNGIRNSEMLIHSDINKYIEKIGTIFDRKVN